MTDEEYIARRSHLASQNVMTADNPPADDLQALQEEYTQQCYERLLDGLWDDSERIQEYIMEGDYENTHLKLVFQKISDIMKTPGNLTSFSVAKAVDIYLRAEVFKEAEEHVNGL